MTINDEDGIIDAGETINLGIAIRNRWGNAKEITVSIDTLSPGGVPNPYVELLADTITLPNVGTFGQVDNGFVYDDSYLNDLTNPLQIRIKDECPNDANILVNLKVTAKNGWEVTDQTIYSSDDTFTFWVQRGRALKGEIQNCGLVPDEGTTNSFTLTKDYYWIIENGLYIPPKYTLNVEKGTQIQFWSKDFDYIYNNKTIAYIQNDGVLNIIGQESEPIEVFSGKQFEEFIIEMFGLGNTKIIYTFMSNPHIAVDTIDHSYFYQPFDFIMVRVLQSGTLNEFPGSAKITSNSISNSIFFSLEPSTV